MSTGALFSDTDPHAEQVLYNLYRQTPIWRRLDLMGQLNQLTRAMARCSLHERFPDATKSELYFRFASLLYGRALAEQCSYRQENWGQSMMNELISTLLLVTGTLEQLSIPYFVGGSIASTSYGVVRTTLDADLVAKLSVQHVNPLIQELGPVFYADGGMIRDAILQQSSFNLIHLNTLFKIDVFIPKSRPFEKQQFKRRRLLAVDESGQHKVYVASPEDTILSKLEWYRLGNEISDRQWQDVLGVLKVQAEHLDRPYLEQWAANLSLTDLLKKAFEASGT
jgi:hypothetical protein